MTESTIRRRLRKEGYQLMKRGDGFMIVSMDRNLVFAGGLPFAYCYSWDDVVEWVGYLAIRRM